MEPSSNPITPGENLPPAKLVSLEYERLPEEAPPAQSSSELAQKSEAVNQERLAQINRTAADMLMKNPELLTESVVESLRALNVPPEEIDRYRATVENLEDDPEAKEKFDKTWRGFIKAKMTEAVETAKDSKLIKLGAKTAGGLGKMGRKAAFYGAAYAVVSVGVAFYLGFGAAAVFFKELFGIKSRR